MTILAFDASTEALSVALYDRKRAIDEACFEIAPREHANKLLPLAQGLLDRHGLALSDLEALAFARGPGAFTGLRIAAGLVQGLAIGASCPVVPVSTLAALAARALAAVPGAAYAQIVQDARMGEIYTATFARNALAVPRTAERVIAPQDLAIETGGDVVRAGNGWALLDITIDSDLMYPHARDVAHLAAAAWARGETLSAEQAVPVYVRDDVARKPAAVR
ncbi:MAG: tRNA (adenosine(37)-N6)-threonylcarbamoyltransferase complex dimerization subunit type 1 TsaB [Xanthomonadales bacterium]|nr:tRNA (adenosine(37)-N6)-threonylcarbamoyltransferase complex dimerization subunit type 1 TsaB [Xanthomonadales bacterium]